VHFLNYWFTKLEKHSAIAVVVYLAADLKSVQFPRLSPFTWLSRRTMKAN
jgi:hypothetical protein